MNLDPAELEPYRQLHGARLSRHPVAGPCFVCEGRFLVEAALSAAAEGRLNVLSVLTGEKTTITISPDIPHFVLEESALHELVGFPFHRGVLCAVALPPEPDTEFLMAANRLVVLPHVDNVDNLGLVLRSAAALGIDGLLAGRGPGLFERRTVRVSMGAAWALPAWQREDPWPLLEAWKRRGGEIVGAALTPEAQRIQEWEPAPRTALVLGSEAHGLDATWLQRCDRLVQIPMARRMDSLNLASAAAILLHHMTQDRTE
ncbi:MAG: RNA methyltransferase [Firmicutes bacterium]|nr:RNA methyltransferase [Bacillota bacterium]